MSELTNIIRAWIEMFLLPLQHALWFLYWWRKRIPLRLVYQVIEDAVRIGTDGDTEMFLLREGWTVPQVMMLQDFMFLAQCWRFDKWLDYHVRWVK